MTVVNNLLHQYARNVYIEALPRVSHIPIADGLITSPALGHLLGQLLGWRCPTGAHIPHTEKGVGASSCPRPALRPNWRLCLLDDLTQQNCMILRKLLNSSHLNAPVSLLLKWTLCYLSCKGLLKVLHEMIWAKWHTTTSINIWLSHSYYDNNCYYYFYIL